LCDRTRCRFFIHDMLWCALIHVCVRLELEEKVHSVDDQKDLARSDVLFLEWYETYHAGPSTDFQHHLCSFCRHFGFEGGMESSLLRLAMLGN